MKTVFSLEPLQRSIFLAGPTPRSTDVLTWRKEALRILEHDLGFDGTVFVPETRGWTGEFDTDKQIPWEWQALNEATVVLFWIPRDLKTMPGLTTNVEFGHLASSSRLVLGFPEGARKMTYLHAMADRFGIPVHRDLRSALQAVVEKTLEPYAVR